MKNVKRMVRIILCCMGIIMLSSILAPTASRAANKMPEEYFDYAWYYFKHHAEDDTIQRIGRDAAKLKTDYYTRGIRKGYSPNIAFDPKYYLDVVNQDLKKAGINSYEKAYQHFVDNVLYRDEKRVTSVFFNMKWYYSKYSAEFKKARIKTSAQLFGHYCMYGCKEGRQGSSTVEGNALRMIYNPEKYAEVNPDIRDAFGDGTTYESRASLWEHFFTYFMFYPSELNAHRKTSAEFHFNFYATRGYTFYATNKLTLHEKIFWDFVSTDKKYNGYKKGRRGIEKQISLSSVKIASKPAKLTYRYGEGESLNTKGLALTATYSDQISKTVSSGFTCSGYTGAFGTNCITVKYGTKATTFDVQVVKGSQPVTGTSSYARAITCDGTYLPVVLDVKNTKPDGGSFSYALKNPEKDSRVLEIDAQTGEIRIKDGGNAAIVATAAETNYYEKQDYVINVSVSSEIKFDPNGGSLNTISNSVIKAPGEEIQLGEIRPERTGYIFEGWGLSKDADTYLYAPNGTYVNDGCATLYAVWKPVEVTINLYPFSDTDAGKKTVKEYYGNKVSLVEQPYVREGYIFVGWAHEKNQPVPEYKWEAEYGVSGVYTDNTVNLYGVWQVKTYTIRYDANGGEGGPQAQKKIHGENIQIPETMPQRYGYEFVGWADTPDADEAQYRIRDEYGMNANGTLYAVWRTASYHVTYDLMGGTGGPDSQGKTHGISLKLSETEPSREGFEFGGWSTNQGEVYGAGDMLDTDADVTLFALWIGEGLTVTYVAKEGSNVPISQIVRYGEKTRITGSEPEWSGHSFAGWSRDQNASVAEYKAGDEISIDKDTTLYAVWATVSCNLKYNLEGGSGGPVSQSVEYGSEVIISDVKPQKSGYEFVGWTAYENSNTVTHNAGEKYTVTEDINLYAIWNQKEHNIYFDLNGGKGGPVKQSFQEGSIIDLSERQPQREGYTFAGWASGKDAVNAEYGPGERYVCGSADVHLYAVWNIESYEVSYNANGGSGAPETVTKNHGEILTVSEEVPVRNGYVFKGWSDASQGNTVEWESGATIEVDHTITLYAVWTPKQYAVKYDANGGQGEPARQMKSFGEDLVLSSLVPTREGYAFLGWSVSQDAQKAEYASGESFKLNQETTLYAVWGICTYTLKYDVNQGTGKIESQKGTYEAEVSVSEKEPTRKGYQFLGWSLKQNGDTPDWKQGDTIAMYADVILYAVWQKETYTVSFDANGGAFAPQEQLKPYGEQLSLSYDKPTRAGYTFIGWAQEENSAEADYMPGDSYRTESDLTLYAVWLIDTFRVTYKGNGGTGVPDKQVKEYGVNLVLTDGLPTRDGYTFLGWSDNAYSSDVKYLPGWEYREDEDIVLYAVWKKNAETNEPEGDEGTNEPDEVNEVDNKSKQDTGHLLSDDASAITVASKVNVVLSEKVSLKARSDGKLSYASSNTKVAVVDQAGIVTGKKCGKVIITVKGQKAMKKVTVYVLPKRVKIKGAKVVVRGGKRGVLIKWSKMSNITKYEFQISKTRKFAKDTSKTGTYIVKKNTVSSPWKYKKAYVRVRALVKIGGKQMAGKWSMIHTITR